nr:MAG TPA: hypothetical protein [Caudoviricetes sp.]
MRSVPAVSAISLANVLRTLVYRISCSKLLQ